MGSLSPYWFYLTSLVESPHANLGVLFLISADKRSIRRKRTGAPPRRAGKVAAGMGCESTMTLQKDSRGKVNQFDEGRYAKEMTARLLAC